MKQFNLNNQLTKQTATIIAETRYKAKEIAFQLAIDLKLDSIDNHPAYWIETQAYHNTEGFTELKAPKLETTKTTKQTKESNAMHNQLLNDQQTILLNSKGYELTQSNLDNKFNLIDNRNGLVIHETHKLSVMVKYLIGMGYI